jgi:hypothetical protein
VREEAGLPAIPPEAAIDDNDEASVHSFIIHAWREESSNKLDQIIWRGYITPVPGGERHYFTDLNEITTFIVAHLTEIG